MNYPQSTSTISKNIGSFSLAKVQAHVRVYNSACWAQAAINKDAAQQYQKEFQKNAQHNICHHYLLNKNLYWNMRSQQSPLFKGISCRLSIRVRRWSISIKQVWGTMSVIKERRVAGLRLLQHKRVMWGAFNKDFVSGETKCWEELSVIRIQESFYHMRWKNS